MPHIKELPNTKLDPSGRTSKCFLEVGVSSFRDAASYVASLPYGRNSDRADFSLVLSEHRGTCSSKHALIATLAQELELPISLKIAIYKMTEDNTPGVGTVLDAHGLDYLPEAHCFLDFRGFRIDLTSAERSGDLIDTFLYSENIDPSQVVSYKTQFHRNFLSEWLQAEAASKHLTLDEVWAIREECIARLSA